MTFRFSALLTTFLAGCGGATEAPVAPAGDPPPMSSVAPTPSSSGGGNPSPPAPPIGVAPAAWCSATPQRLADAPAAAGGTNKLVLHGGAAFWQAGTTLSKTTLGPATAGSTTVLSSASRELVGVDGSDVVWTEGADRALVRTTVDGASETAAIGVSLADFSGSFTAPLLAVTNGRVLWADGKLGGGAYRSVPIAGGPPTLHHLASSWVTVGDSWIASGDRMSWTTSGALWTAEVASDAGATMLSNAAGLLLGPSPNGVYVASTMMDVREIVVATGIERRLFAAAPQVAAPTGCAGQTGKYGSDSVVVGGDDAVYMSMWADCLDAESDRRTVVRVRPGETAASEIVSFAVSTAATTANVPIAVDESCLYYVGHDARVDKVSLMAVAR